MPILPFSQLNPRIDPSCFIAPDAWVIGDVTIAANCSIFFGAVLRGDIMPLVLGEGSNVQEYAIFHTSTDYKPTEIGKNVTVGHAAILHGCTVGDHCIIGMNSTLLDGAEIAPYSIVGANSLVPMNFKADEGSLILGTPARVVRKLKPEERSQIEESARHYQQKRQQYLGLLSPQTPPLTR